MLCQFAFSNYRSYQDETVLTMQATRLAELSDTLIQYGDKQRFLPVCALYGPNAGGKSNLLEALEFLCDAVSNPIVVLKSSRTAGQRSVSGAAPLPHSSPFAFDTESKLKHTSFEVYFRVGSYEYRYYLAVHVDQIVAELLQRRKIGASRTALLFERDVEGVTLGLMLRRSGVSTTFNPEIPYLSYLRMNTDIDAIREAADWFVNTSFLNYGNRYLEESLEDSLVEERGEEIVAFLKAVDVSISGIRFERSAPDDGSRSQRVYIKHRVADEEYELRLGEESSGTQKLIGLATPLLEGLRRGSLVVADELDAKLHPKLLRYIVLLFKNAKANPCGAQLIFTTQNVAIMRGDILRRDEIWFAERDTSGRSMLWSLADLREPDGSPVGRAVSYERPYLFGKYGADPQLERIEEWF